MCVRTSVSLLAIAIVAGVLRFRAQSTYVIGRNGGVVDIVLDHPSSSRKHAALVHGPKGYVGLEQLIVESFVSIMVSSLDDSSVVFLRACSVLLLDLGSSHGTFLNGEKLSPFDYQLINPGQDTIIFGASSKVYSFRRQDEGSGGRVLCLAWLGLAWLGFGLVSFFLSLPLSF